MLVGVSADDAGEGRALGGDHAAARRGSPASRLRTRPPQGAVQLIVRGEIAALPLKGVIDFAAEKARLEKEMARVDADIARIDAKLGNADFVAARAGGSGRRRAREARGGASAPP